MDKPHRSREDTPALAIPEPGQIILGDNLQVITAWPDEFVDLIYIDPPFNTGSRRRLQSIKLHSGDRVRQGFGGKTYRYEVRSDISYDDSMSTEEYKEFLRQRIEQGHRILKKTGSFFIHIDSRVVHHVRFLMDEVFGEERFINEIIWAYDYGGRPSDRWPPKHDNILWYSKSSERTFNREAIDRIPYMAPGLVGKEKAARGKLPTDTWWLTIVPTNGPERTGYPTQKPEKLLQRIIVACSDPGDLVVDFFAGSGTTGVVAEKLGRTWIMVDNSPDAIRIMTERMRKNGQQGRLSLD